MRLSEKIKLQIRCLRDAKCYLAYSNERTNNDRTITYDYLIGHLEINAMHFFSVLTCPFEWSKSIKGFNYWSNKWLNCRYCYFDYINKQ